MLLVKLPGKCTKYACTKVGDVPFELLVIYTVFILEILPKILEQMFLAVLYKVQLSQIDLGN